MKPKIAPDRICAVLADYDLLPGWRHEDFPTAEQAPEDQVPELERLIDAANGLSVIFSRIGVEPLDQEIFNLYHAMSDEIAQRLLGTGLHLVIAPRKARAV